MNIDERVERVCRQAFPEWTFMLEDWHDADAVIDRSPLPAVVDLLPTGGNVSLRNGKARDTQHTSIAFLDRVARDADGGDSGEVYNRMKAAAMRFVAACNASGLFEPVERYGYTVIYNQLASIVTGVLLDIDLKAIGECER